jgi:hypothetical protein
MTIRLGAVASRFSPDFDTARLRTMTIDAYVDSLEERLSQGWESFSGTVTRLRPATPAGVPTDYVI